MEEQSFFVRPITRSRRKSPCTLTTALYSILSQLKKYRFILSVTTLFIIVFVFGKFLIEKVGLG